MLREGETGSLEQPVGYFGRVANSSMVPMAGPWWYHTATSVLRVHDLPFSLLRMLILTPAIVAIVGVDSAQGTGLSDGAEAPHQRSS